MEAIPPLERRNDVERVRLPLFNLSPVLARSSCIWVKDIAVPEITPRFDPSDPVDIPSLHGFRERSSVFLAMTG